ncbi:DUF2007 domain-containing protein [Marinobacter nauticus]|uniref:DUF2007 domain-containing protein n=1 Tax=Marinobacter nauticus TaxID=2743 RepID=A0A1M2V0C3_MARNT|nr:DUF2007 domain-containing protein [Marinobacter nauticus]OJT01032.1 hypothetical protein BEE62_13765 [Marinobacter nauticus]
MQIAYRARDITEAHIVAGMLEANGIDTYVGGHYLQGAMGEIGAAGFSNVHVDDDDVYRARRLIDEYESDQTVVASERDQQDKPDRYARWFIIVLVALAWFLWRF